MMTPTDESAYTTAFRRVDSTLAPSLPICGLNLVWNARNVRVTREDLEAALSRHNLESYLPEPVSARLSLRRALDAWLRQEMRDGGASPMTGGGSGEGRAGRDAEGSETRSLVRVINSRGSDFVVYAVVAEHVDLAAYGLSYGTRLRVRLDKETKRLTVTTEGSGEFTDERENPTLVRAILPYWKEFRSLYLSPDLTGMIRRMIADLDSVAVRREGGVYFVPAHAEPRVRTIQAMLAEINSGCRDGDDGAHLTALPVTDEARARRELARAVHAGIVGEIEALAYDLQRFTQAPEGTVRPQTIAERLTAYREMRRKTQFYSELLDMRRADIDRALDELTSRARAVVTGLDQLTRGAKSAPRDDAPPLPGNT